jgi:hypothetical protein
MIIHSNIQRFEGMPFVEYQQLNGFSHSFLKYQKAGITELINPTDKMKLGSLVDALLTDGEFNFLDPQATKALAIASHIKEKFGDLIKHFKCQVSYTGDMTYNGFKMRTTGRPDWELLNEASIDLKVTAAKSAKEFLALINHMGYNNQVWNYSKLGGFKKGYIIPYSASRNCCLGVFQIPIIETNSFWERAIVEFGEAI